MRILLIGYMLLLFSVARGQKAVELIFTPTSSFVPKTKLQTHFDDSLSALRYLTDLRLKAIRKGYLLASVDSLRFGNKELRAVFYAGPLFGKAHLRMQQKELDFVRRNGGLSPRLIRKTKFRPAEISQLIRNIQRCYENNGYPFCRVYLDSVSINGTELDARLQIEPQQFLRFKKINLVGNPVLSVKLVSSFIQIVPGDPFDQSLVVAIPDRIKQLGFVEESKPAELLFTAEGVEVFLYLRARPVSLINGVVGFQPDPLKGKLTITGELRLKLVNVFKKAETMDLHWRSIQSQTQSLRMNLVAPNLFQTPFGIDGQFQLYKRDSTFLETKATLGIQYAMRKGNYLKAIYRRYNSNVLAGGNNNPTFSNLASVQTNFYGFSLNRQQVDYLPAPTRGLLYQVEATIGRRQHKDSANRLLTETTYRGEAMIQWYLPMAKRHILRLAGFSELYFAPAYFQNEAFRFGGQQTLRGFREEELQATSRAVATVEYRFMLDRSSFLFAFYDQSWYENRSVPVFVTDTPTGFGGGLTFGTNLGVFSISYALSRQFGNPVQLREGKVHFGYISYF